jgi:hypothetical protein
MACVYDLQGNPDKAVGEIKGLSVEQQNITEAKRILAIAYFHRKDKEKAMAIWNELKL